MKCPACKINFDQNHNSHKYDACYQHLCYIEAVKFWMTVNIIENQEDEIHSIAFMIDTVNFIFFTKEKDLRVYYNTSLNFYYLEYFEPDLNNLPELIEKLKTYMLLL